MNSELQLFESIVRTICQDDKKYGIHIKYGLEVLYVYTTIDGVISDSFHHLELYLLAKSMSLGAYVGCDAQSNCRLAVF